MQAFFRRVKKGDAPGFPKFKSGRRWDSIEIESPYKGMVTSKKGRPVVKIKGLPILVIQDLRELPDSVHLKKIVIKRTPLGVYASLMYECEFEELPGTGQSVGVDMGVTTRFALSDGNDYDRRPTINHGDIQRKIETAKRGSGNQLRLRRRLAKSQRREKVRGRNELHRITTDKIMLSDYIAIEDLQVANMTRSASGTVEKPGRNVAQKRGLNREILSQGWAMARRQLEYKARRFGRRLVAVNPAHTSQTCSVCENVDAKARKGKLYNCTRCGVEMDADTNAARVILRRAQHNAGVGLTRGASEPATTAQY